VLSGACVFLKHVRSGLVLSKAARNNQMNAHDNRNQDVLLTNGSKDSFITIDGMGGVKGSYIPYGSKVTLTFSAQDHNKIKVNHIFQPNKRSNTPSKSKDKIKAG